MPLVLDVCPSSELISFFAKCTYSVILFRFEFSATYATLHRLEGVTCKLLCTLAPFKHDLPSSDSTYFVYLQISATFIFLRSCLK